MVGKTISHYRVLDELGRGGMGVVYRAEDLRLGRQVALKFLPGSASGDRQALDRFQREARAASALNHPHICTIHDIDEFEGQPFIVMELLEGQPLARRLAAKRFDVEGVLDVATQIAEALEAAHAKGIIHRDIKPANIFITDAGQVKILDFGLAKLVAEQHGNAPHQPADSQPTVLSLDALVTGPGQTMGTAAYMSPEQVRGEALDARSDIFSFGGVIYETATGHLPFPGATTGVIFDGILNKPPAQARSLNATLPLELEAILNKALEKDRDLRYQSVRDLRADLMRLRRDSVSGRTSAVGAPPIAPPRPRRSYVAVATVGTAVAALAVAVYFAWPIGNVIRPTGPATLARVTFETGLQAEPAWSPDGRFIAYSSDQAGNFDIWVQPLGGGGRALQVTSDPASDWSPAWSPDGNSIAFRSERDGGGIFVAPALGGRERKVAAFGYWPKWSADSSQLLFEVRPIIASASLVIPHVYVVPAAGGEPKRILEAELAAYRNVSRMTWHPDGKRVTFVAMDGPNAGMWTVSIAGGAPVASMLAEEVAAQLKQAAMAISSFTWAPKGDALYVEGSSTGIQNLWRIGVEPRTLRWISGPDRLTTGPGIDGDIAVSADGTRLAFVTKTETSRLWSIPFDAAGRRVTGEAQPVTPPNVIAMGFDVSPDGKRLVFVARRPGKQATELWSRSMEEGKDTMIGEAISHFAPRLSSDSSSVAYRVTVQGATMPQRRLKWIALTGGEEHSMPAGLTNPWNWSPDGARLLHGCPPSAKTPSICATAPAATSAAETVTVVTDPEYSIWQGRYSPDGRWIAFNAQHLKDAGVSIIGLAPAAGGKWRPLTARTLWADKPRWAPDGRTIYFISNREGAFFDVWGLRIDPDTGTPQGEEFRVTRFDSPGRTLTAAGFSELGVSAIRLVVPLTETSGGIWTLDNIRR